MDRTVIIDGVVVSGCRYFWDKNPAGTDLKLCKLGFDNNYFSNGLALVEKCNKHPNCYYKELKRLQAENEKLKQQLKQQQYKRELDYGQGYKAYATEKGVFVE